LLIEGLDGCFCALDICLFSGHVDEFPFCSV
jgi:hypothetical protein